MKIKTKLNLGVGLLFALIVLLCVVSATYIYQLKADTVNILAANYNTLEYSRNILAALEEKPGDKAFEKFAENLRKQEKNVTEVREKESTEALRKNFNKVLVNATDSTATPDSALYSEIRKNIFDLMDVNMQAIQRKSEVAQTTADNAIFWVALTGSICFLIAFLLLINLPANIANPIKELTDSIQQIAAKNYSERVDFEGHSEFGQLANSFNTMAQKLQEYSNSSLAKLMMEKKRIETLINNMHDPVIGFDENLNVLFANQEAIKITGIESANFIGQHAHKLALTNDLIRTLMQDVTQTDADRLTLTAPIKIFADNKEGYFEKETLKIAITPTGERDDRIIGYVVILRNVTAHKELDFAKTNFIATVSHEFKTPIAAIKMSLQLLKNQQIGLMNEEQQNLLISIEEDASRLLKITGELLDMAQVESGKIQFSIASADPEEMLSYAINANRSEADLKQVRFDVSCPKDLPKVRADYEKTAWVLTNLISNAIRYSYDNSIIYLSIMQENDLVQISVRDTGQGIAPQYKDRVFDRYFRVPGTKKEGTGLGLAISKEFIEAQGGEISVESEFGAGSTFTVTLSTFA